MTPVEEEITINVDPEIAQEAAQRLYDVEKTRARAVLDAQNELYEERERAKAAQEERKRLVQRATPGEILIAGFRAKTRRVDEIRKEEKSQCEC